MYISHFPLRGTLRSTTMFSISQRLFPRPAWLSVATVVYLRLSADSIHHEQYPFISTWSVSQDLVNKSELPQGNNTQKREEFYSATCTVHLIVEGDSKVLSSNWELNLSCSAPGFLFRQRSNVSGARESDFRAHSTNFPTFAGFFTRPVVHYKYRVFSLTAVQRNCDSLARFAKCLSLATCHAENSVYPTTYTACFCCSLAHCLWLVFQPPCDRRRASSPTSID